MLRMDSLASMWKDYPSNVLDDADGLRAVQRAAKNILDYGADERLGDFAKLSMHTRRRLSRREG